MPAFSVFDLKDCASSVIPRVHSGGDTFQRCYRTTILLPESVTCTGWPPYRLAPSATDGSWWIVDGDFDRLSPHPLSTMNHRLSLVVHYQLIFAIDLHITQFFLFVKKEFKPRFAFRIDLPGDNYGDNSILCG